MKSNKVVLSTVAGLCTLLLTGTPSAQAVFQDTAGHWAQSAIERMHGYQIVNGFGGQFRPDETITRGEMAVVLDHVMRYQNRADNRFSDLGQDFYTDAILKAGHAGVLQGAEGKVRPNDAILREEAVVMMARAFDIAASDIGAIHVPDAGSIASWSAGTISAFIQKGYVSGTEAFRPKEPITRAETIAILNRILTGYYPMAGSFSQSANGTVVVNTQDVSLRDMTIAGDLILSEGVQDGDIALENVIVNGRVLIRGGGAHSIHVRGKSVLGTVVMERDGAAVRLSVDGKDAKVENVTVGEKAAEAIVTGDVSTVTVAGSGKLTAQDAKIGTISVTAPNASVELTGKSNVKTVEVAEGAKNADVSVDKNASIRTIAVEAEGADISGAGKVSTVKANADNVSVDTKGTSVTAAKGTSGITAGGQKVPAGGSTNSTPSKNESSSSGSSSHRPSRPEELAVERVESVQNGLVRVTLNRASDTTLRQDQFSIICTGGGHDMTILSVHTTDNRVYDLRTAFYKDNTYQLGILLDDGKLLTYDFVSKYDCPTITSTEAVRTAADEAEFTFVSDVPGTFYWTLEAKANTRFYRAANGEPTAAEIMASGHSQQMNPQSNTVKLTGLMSDTAYTMYYVAKDADNKVTPVKRIEIAGTPAEKPDESDIKIVDASAHKTGTTDFMGEHVYFEIRLSRATDTKLTLDRFKITCPSSGDIPLERVESSDNQTYTAYLKKGYKIKDNNHFTCTITFADGTQASNKFFVDLTGPNLTGHRVTRLPGDKAEIQFTSNEPGKIYYKVLTADEFNKGDGGAKDPNIVINGGETHNITAGTQSFEVDFSGKTEKTGLFFCYVAEDKLGNRATFWYENIPDQETKPEVNPGQSEYQITSITGQVEDQYVGRGHVLTVTVNKNETGSSLLSNSTTKIRGPVPAGGHQQIEIACSSNNPTEHEVTLRQITLTEGDYTFEAEIEGKTATKEFHVDAQGMVTSR